MKLWGGRFSKATDARADEFLASIEFDKRLAEDDVAGSIAHARMLGRQGIISEDEARQIVDGLEAILQEIRDGRFSFRIDREDIHLNVEAALRERIGQVAGKLHTARSRNDQVALDVRLYVKRAIRDVQRLLLAVIEVLLDQAERHVETVMPGYTHLQRAQPVVLAHHFLAYVEMFRRDVDRLDDCYRRTDVMPLGAGALAGTTFPIDRRQVARDLGFADVARNSLDAVSDRDFVVELLACASLIAMHTSRLAEELVLWSSSEFGFVQLDDAFATGSSIMPQKKNPDSAELVRGKTGRVYGNLLGVLTVLKGLPLAYNKDMQEDKEPLFDSADTLTSVLTILRGVLETLRVSPEAMRAATRSGFLTATDLADHLVRRGMPFREAHEVVGRLVAYCIERGKELSDLSPEELRRFSRQLDESALDVLDVDRAVRGRNVPGGPAPERVAEAVAEARAYLDSRAAGL